MSSSSTKKRKLLTREGTAFLSGADAIDIANLDAEEVAKSAEDGATLLKLRAFASKLAAEA